MPGLYDLSKSDLAEILTGPSYRADQLWAALYGKGLDIADVTSLPKGVRRTLASDPRLAGSLLERTTSASDNGATVKWLWELHDGALIETVLMHYSTRSTVCISSQAGCAMACSFCATGQAGFDRQLAVGEIVEQVVRARRAAMPRRLSNIVFMGMGEPLANYDAVWCSVERIHYDLGLSARSITVSTVGVVPGIRRLAAETLPVNLAVSLHLANDEERNELVPLNKRYPLNILMDACEEYIGRKRRRISFEWALIDGVNDRARDIEELSTLAKRLRAHVNLIPLNPTPGYPVRGTPPERVRAFRRMLTERGVNATVRRTRGTEIDAACGQLRAGHRSTAADDAGPRTFGVKMNRNA